jgi:putative cell wall-binding protein
VVGREAFPSSRTVIVASADPGHLVDGIVAAPFARKLGAPVLLTTRDVLPAVVRDDIELRRATSVIVLGGRAAVSTDVVEAIAATGASVERIAGDTKFDTAAAIARRVGGSKAFIASGESGHLVDAVAAGAAAAAMGDVPILLASRDAIPDATSAALADLAVDHVWVPGGDHAIAEKTYRAIPVASKQRFAGVSRFATAAMMATEFSDVAGGSQHVIVVSGREQNMVDALPGGTLGELILLTQRDSLPPATSSWLHENGTVSATVLGGTMAVSARVATQLADALRAAPPAPTPGPADGHLMISKAELMALPTRGAAWESMRTVADGPLGTPDLVDQDNVNAGRTVAAALVYARTGQTSYRTKVVAQLRLVAQLPLSGTRTLSLGRQLGGYVIAADLVGYREPQFVDFIDRIRTQDVGGHGRWYSLSQTAADTGNNWGAWALASRIAASRYLGDSKDVAEAARIFRGFTGDRDAYAGFRPTSDFDLSWACGGAAGWVPINPASCGDRGGAIVEDISRSRGSYPAVDKTGLTYSWETLGGAVLSAELLSRAGYHDVYQWGDKALLRAAEFLHRQGGYPVRYSVNQYIPWSINRAYNVDLGPVNPAGYGRQFGYTDWLP